MVNEETNDSVVVAAKVSKQLKEAIDAFHVLLSKSAEEIGLEAPSFSQCIRRILEAGLKTLGNGKAT